MTTIFSKCCGARKPFSKLSASYGTESKPILSPRPQFKSEQELADHIIDTLFTSEKPSSGLSHRLKSTAEDQHTQLWFDKNAIAKKVLDGLVQALKNSVALAGALKESFDKATAVVREFVHEHPVLTGIFLTVVALVMLWYLTPWVLEWLGFSESGPVINSFAAWWQSTFPEVPAGSFFAWLQRLAMTWGK